MINETPTKIYEIIISACALMGNRTELAILITIRYGNHQPIKTETLLFTHNFVNISVLIREFG